MNGNQLLQNKTIIVTGAATGIGQAFSVACASYGAKIIVAHMNSGVETVELIESKGGEAKFVEVDVANEDKIRKITNQEKKHLLIKHQMQIHTVKQEHL